MSQVGVPGVNKSERRLTPSDFEEVLDDTLSTYVQDRIERYDFRYYELGSAQKDFWIHKIVGVLLEAGGGEVGVQPLEDFQSALNSRQAVESVQRSGEKRLSQWKEGWGQNLAEFIETSDPTAVIPRYFGKYDVVRWRQEFIEPAHKDFERNSLAVIQDWIFDTYMRKAEAVYEFGCGTGHNLLRVREVNPEAELWGLDWAESSQDIIREFSTKGLDKNIHPHKFDFFRPDWDFNLSPGGVVYTVAALEQVGQNFQDFVEYLMNQKPALCIHIEPIEELLDPENLLDYLSIQYFRKRNYLSGFLECLKNLERQGKLEIVKASRTYIGSLFIEGYSVIVWSPNR